MGFLNKKPIIKTEGFHPIDLNEDNVQAIFNRCGKANADGSTTWDEEALQKNRAEIRYLLGQLALVHEGVEEHAWNNAFFKKYTGEAWTGAVNSAIALLNMGFKSGFSGFFEKDSMKFVKLQLIYLKPTLSPQDPKFAAWWEGADGLMIQAEAAESENKLSEALSLYEKAAQLGNAGAQYICGEMYYDGKGTAVDYAKALYWYEKAAKQNHLLAQLECRKMYEKGEGTAADEAKALYWLEKAAEQGNAYDQYECGEMYDDGRDLHHGGIPKDKDKAAKALYWYEKAAEQGHEDAQLTCSLWYDNGYGTTVNKAKALYWMEKRAERGDATAQFACGMRYIIGEGTEPDLAKAKAWIQKAAAQTEDKEIQEQAKEYLRDYF